MLLHVLLVLPLLLARKRDGALATAVGEDRHCFLSCLLGLLLLEGLLCLGWRLVAGAVKSIKCKMAYCLALLVRLKTEGRRGALFSAPCY